MIEIRWVWRPFQGVKEAQERVLQYRTWVVLIDGDNSMYTKKAPNGYAYQWTDWQDVPTVKEP